MKFGESGINPFITISVTRVMSSHPSRIKPSDFQVMGINLLDVRTVNVAQHCEMDTCHAIEFCIRGDSDFPYTIVDPKDVELFLSTYYKFASGRKFDFHNVGEVK